MPDIHSIRLREPWQREQRNGRVCWSRSFNWPAGLTPREKVRIVIEGLANDTKVSLNGVALCENYDVTSLIVLTNKLEIEMTDDGGNEFPLEVRLDIDEG